MSKLSNVLALLFFIGSLFFLFSCEKEANVDTITSNDAVQARLAYTEKGYTEKQVNSIVKKDCYFPVWNKNIMTPVSGLFEYYDAEENWVASIDFGDGTCDEWAIKTWDVVVFSDYPSGSNKFSVFNYKGKK